jgi:hypothetical protein
MEMALVPKALGLEAAWMVHTKVAWLMHPDLEAGTRRAATLAAQAAPVGVMQVPPPTGLMAPREARQMVP